MNERESEPNSGPQPDCPTDKTPSSPPSSFEGRPDTRLPSMSMENLLRRIESPAMKMAREMAKSPLDRLMPSIDHLTSVKEGLRSNVLGEFCLPQTPGIEAIKSAIEDHTASALSVLSGVPDELKEALRQYDSALRQIEAITAPLRAQSELLEAITAYIPKEVLAASQEAQWFNTISRFSGPHTPSTLGNSLEILLRDFGDVAKSACRNDFATKLGELRKLLEVKPQLSSEFETTRLKMALFAGTRSTYEPFSPPRLEAYQSLFGTFRSHPNLPDSFWDDPTVRDHTYRKANVDTGLIAATPGTALEIMIESGFSAGFGSGEHAVAIINYDHTSMVIRSRHVGADAHAVIHTFENDLRTFIDNKLRERHGDNWFKIAASNLVGKAKSTRNTSLINGEQTLPLINYVDFGDLASIVLSNNNWKDVFAPTFIDKVSFTYDMQRLIALRRPDAHNRTIDAVRLVEAICVVQRLTAQMNDDGAWRTRAESDC